MEPFNRWLGCFAIAFFVLGGLVLLVGLALLFAMVEESVLSGGERLAWILGGVALLAIGTLFRRISRKGV